VFNPLGLKKKHPDVSARLWQMYVATGKLCKRSETLFEQAKLFIRESKFNEAAKSLEEAVEIEFDRENYIADIRYVYALFVARYGLSAHYKNVDRICAYGQAISVAQKFMLRGAQALIAYKLQDFKMAKKHAGIALWFVEQEDFEASVGLVTEELAQDIDRLKFIFQSGKMN
jgi:tetratricopeptide (TPR) repeat protein